MYSVLTRSIHPIVRQGRPPPKPGERPNRHPTFRYQWTPYGSARRDHARHGKRITTTTSTTRAYLPDSEGEGRTSPGCEKLPMIRRKKKEEKRKKTRNVPVSRRELNNGWWCCVFLVLGSGAAQTTTLPLPPLPWHRKNYLHHTTSTITHVPSLADWRWMCLLQPRGKKKGPSAFIQAPKVVPQKTEAPPFARWRRHGRLDHALA